MICHMCSMSDRYKVIWPCLTSWCCIAPFYQACYSVFILETLLCFDVTWTTIHPFFFFCYCYHNHASIRALLKFLPVTLDTIIFILILIWGLYTSVWPIAFGNFKKSLLDFSYFCSFNPWMIILNIFVNNFACVGWIGKYKAKLLLFVTVNILLYVNW